MVTYFSSNCIWCRGEFQFSNTIYASVSVGCKFIHYVYVENLFKELLEKKRFTKYFVLLVKIVINKFGKKVFANTLNTSNFVMVEAITFSRS